MTIAVDLGRKATKQQHKAKTNSADPDQTVSLELFPFIILNSFSAFID